MAVALLCPWLAYHHTENAEYSPSAARPPAPAPTAEPEPAPDRDDASADTAPWKMIFPVGVLLAAAVVLIWKRTRERQEQQIKNSG